eukprot:TRINITY_DN7036_c0_g1_i2.p3 TRINITY_DN7036_c0_g1~~TRINITY_DN7036_c0_g1_i2.p3  ORF type:complete len:108 (-),score=26.17 TRINITY_DN7036_c0_g1_i2:302-625(-)
MHSIIFANCPAKDASKIGMTIERNDVKLQFLGNLNVKLQDIAGQPSVLNQYLIEHPEEIFYDVALLIYVFDVQSNQMMDTVAEDFKQQVFEEKKRVNSLKELKHKNQ